MTDNVEIVAGKNISVEKTKDGKIILDSYSNSEGSGSVKGYSGSFGSGHQITGSYAFAYGKTCKVTKNYGFAGGYMTNSYGLYAVALGYKANASAESSFALGYRAITNASATGSFVMVDKSYSERPKSMAALTGYIYSTYYIQSKQQNEFVSFFKNGYRFFGGDIVTEGDIKTFDIFAKGTVKAREIIVDPVVSYDKNGKIAANYWPDYVFEDNYNLMGLNEVENFIEENSHLPNVPSREEVGKNGLNVMEMQHILLRKVEEMTLHMIELNKQNDTLKNEIEILKSNR